MLLASLMLILLVFAAVWFMLGTNAGLNITLSFAPGLKVSDTSGAVWE